MKARNILPVILLVGLGCGPPSGKAEVIGKRYRPAYWTTNYIPVGKVTVPVMQHHPETWHLSLLLREPEERKYSLRVGKVRHDRARAGDYLWLWKGRVVTEAEYAGREAR